MKSWGLASVVWPSKTTPWRKDLDAVPEGRFVLVAGSHDTHLPLAQHVACRRVTPDVFEMALWVDRNGWPLRRVTRWCDLPEMPPEDDVEEP